MNEAQRRYKIVEKPPALPGSCFMCSGEDRPWFFDLNRDIEFHGAAYICAYCFHELADMVDYVPVGDVGIINQQLQDIKEWDASIGETAEELDRVYRELGSSLAGLSRFRDGLGSNPSDVQKSAGQSDGVSGEVSEGERTDSGTSDEPGNEPGLADVRSDAKRSEFKFDSF